MYCKSQVSIYIHIRVIIKCLQAEDIKNNFKCYDRVTTWNKEALLLNR